MAMVLSARRVRMLAPQLMAEATVMLPASVPVPLLPHALTALSAVETVTSPLPSAVWMAVALLESMVMLTGSISYSPPWVSTLTIHQFRMAFQRRGSGRHACGGAAGTPG
ncbi:MAG: hypothetical protein FD149_1842 [Rhodospirillaceae bacterium]|nr:MAG: hypothetical protein FD149_1842 [Rhodospirillaceae bacterium]